MASPQPVGKKNNVDDIIANQEAAWAVSQNICLLYALAHACPKVSCIHPYTMYIHAQPSRCSYYLVASLHSSCHHLLRFCLWPAVSKWINRSTQWFYKAVHWWLLSYVYSQLSCQVCSFYMFISSYLYKGTDNLISFIDNLKVIVIHFPHYVLIASVVKPQVIAQR